MQQQMWSFSLPSVPLLSDLFDRPCPLLQLPTEKPLELCEALPGCAGLSEMQISQVQSERVELDPLHEWMLKWSPNGSELALTLYSY